MFNKHKHMPTCDMLKNSQYVQNQKIGTSNPITLFRKLQKQALLLLDTSKPSGNQLNKIYLCNTSLHIYPYGQLELFLALFILNLI